MNASRRDMLVGGALLAGSALAFAGSTFNRPRPLPAGGLGPLVPERVGKWQSAGSAGVIVPEEGDLSRSTYDEVLTRVYVGEGQAPVMLVLAYGGNQSGSMQLHRPEACYPAAGFVLGAAKSVMLDLPGQQLPARLLEATSPTRSEQILYWTRIGGQFPGSPSAQRWAVVRDNLRGQVPDGALVRLSTIGLELNAAVPVLTDFVRGMTAAAPPLGRLLLVGKA
jgi:EpsI family protein